MRSCQSDQSESSFTLLFHAFSASQTIPLHKHEYIKATILCSLSLSLSLYFQEYFTAVDSSNSPHIVKFIYIQTHTQQKLALDCECVCVNTLYLLSGTTYISYTQTEGWEWKMVSNQLESLTSPLQLPHHTKDTYVSLSLSQSICLSLLAMHVSVSLSFLGQPNLHEHSSAVRGISFKDLSS